ncbi:ketopantoate reductase [Halopenitus malekzadehii]|uniref:2-dehydropantoate 2-reductase n=1 Tax=Halopenitus malekzadehii TaxID=1267564 RepID=A0A1H6ILT7_9EURY|nr:ketopantoate reductase family protein [Halopenitus malekzadehii]SEH49953.1 ketopantoate reductase [Halopenitus malekzadehii]
MRILVFGAGSLGSLVGGLLARTHDVTLVGRDPHMCRVREDGLRIEGAIEAHTRPRALTDGTGERADLAVVTTKAGDTDAAARVLATGRYDTVVSLQNGLTEERLLAALDTRILAGTATYGARLVAPGRVECTGVGEVTVGALSGGQDPAAERVASAFRAAGITAASAADMPRRRFRKLAVNAGINGPTALADVDNAAVAAGPASEVAREAACEVAVVARAEGVDLSNGDALAALERVADATAANHSSMRQDRAAERSTEVDAIYGAAIDRGETHGVETPTCRTIAALVRAWERERGLRPTDAAGRGLSHR